MADAVKGGKGFPDFVQEAEKCTQFLEQFSIPRSRAKKYMALLQRVANRELRLLEIELDDVATFCNGDETFVEHIERNTKRYVMLFARAADALLPQPSVELIATDVIDVLTEQRAQNAAATASEADAMKEVIPKDLTRRFEIVILPRSLTKPVPLRAVRAKDVGALVTMRGIVTKMTDVRPMVTVATYTCDECGFEVYQEVTGRNFTPLVRCESAACKSNNRNGKLFAQTRGSKFVKFQELRLQELPHEVPVGHIPRSVTLHVRGELTRKCTPGDIISVSGVYLVQRYQGYRAVKAGLITDTYLEAMRIIPQKKNYAELEMTPDVERKIDRLSEDVELYTKLSQSIAPEIYGMDDIKKALLLLLVSGISRKLPDGMKIRGDINILLLGDPGVAKSQLLKHISSISPRGIYTTGKGSSGVGLTAAVLRDPVTREMTLEGGALVLADMGICCIDEFDKMEDADRTAIYEVMEQQTVSIAKAGITTTLNARTSVLAAANPQWGRYNKKRTPEENIGLPTALLSRFDLIFILLDQPDEVNDANLARHITTVHRTEKHPKLSFEPFESSFLRAYVARARSYEPRVPRDLTDFIVATYVAMRQEGDKEEDKRRERFCTPRSLLSILRLATSLARLRFAEEVEQSDVDEAVRLLFVAKSQLLDDESKKASNKDEMSNIYDIIKQRSLKSNVLKFSQVQQAVNAKGYSDEALRKCLVQYERMGILQWKEGSTITVLGGKP